MATYCILAAVSQHCGQFSEVCVCTHTLLDNEMNCFPIAMSLRGNRSRERFRESGLWNIAMMRVCTEECAADELLNFCPEF